MTDEKQHRHRCEVRFVVCLARRDKKLADEYVEKVKNARGKKAADALNADALSQYRKGSLGQPGEWHE